MAKRLPSPYQYRGKWRGTVTLPGGKRRSADFEKHEAAKTWIVRMLAETKESSGHESKLGGPTVATLADALTYYAGQWTVTKGGARAELNRINHYLGAAGLEQLRLHVNEKGNKSLMVNFTQVTTESFAAYSAERRALREETYKTIGKLAKRRCSSISTADIREFMSTMTREGLSPSTIQKEIALLRHVFNTAAAEWSWLGFKNPCLGLKLGKSASRFVVLTSAQIQTLMAAAAGCDNPLIPATIGLALDSAMRKGSLLSLDWANINLEHRTLQVGSKSGDLVLALSQTTLAILNNLPQKAEGRVLPLSDNALDMAWEGVREKAGLPKLQFRDLRHVAATRLAKQGMSANQLQRVLGHKSTTMAQVYVNMVQSDMIDVLDKLAPLDPVLVVEPLASDVKDEIRRRRSDRITGAIRKKAQTSVIELTELKAIASSSLTGHARVASASEATERTPHPVEAPTSSQEPTVCVASTQQEGCSMELPSTTQSTAPNGMPSSSSVGSSSNVIPVDFRARRTVNG